MIRLASTFRVVFTFALLASATAADAECAWVLWPELSSIGEGGHSVEWGIQGRLPQSRRAVEWLQSNRGHEQRCCGNRDQTRRLLT